MPILLKVRKPYLSVTENLFTYFVLTEYELSKKEMISYDLSLAFHKITA